MREIIFSLLLALCLVSPISAEKKFLNAVWYNSYQMDLADEKKAKSQIEEHFKKLSALKINAVFYLVKHPDGRLYYRSKFGKTACDWDPLAFVIQECRRYGMEIHPYLNVFAEEGDYLKEHPEQAELKQDGTPQQWASPASPEVRKRMLEMIEELALYPVDGIQLDRIRYEDYPASDSGFHPKAVADYRAKFGK
ncbi:MAG TPA: family 10 glycosylhydrolase, partial [Chroococcales cyanobacterium]